MSKFKIGDNVREKGKNQKMQVAAIKESKVGCTWKENTKGKLEFKVQLFEETQLVKLDDENRVSIFRSV
jgi:uncharacterized protein YodC (DUF2158 family)